VLLLALQVVVRLVVAVPLVVVALMVPLISINIVATMWTHPPITTTAVVTPGCKRTVLLLALVVVVVVNQLLLVPRNLLLVPRNLLLAPLAVVGIRGECLRRKPLKLPKHPPRPKERPKVTPMRRNELLSICITRTGEERERPTCTRWSGTKSLLHKHKLMRIHAPLAIAPVQGTEKTWLGDHLLEECIRQ
jgi:hypothetical protein